MGEAARQAARVAGVSATLVYEAKRLATEDPGLFDRVKNGELSLSTAKRQRQRQAEGGRTRSPKPTRPAKPKATSTTEYARQQADAERSTRAATAIEVLERLGRSAYEPREVADAIPPAQRHRIDAYLQKACDWLEEFARIWTDSNGPA